MSKIISLLLFNKNINFLSTWILVLSLSIHFFFIHGMFDFNVICFEVDGSTNFEYSIDGKTCIEHNDRSIDNKYSFTAVESNSCRDISFSASNHNDDQFVVKKINTSISNTYLSNPVTLNLVAQNKIEFSSIIKNKIKNSLQLDSYKTVLLLI